ncbi:MAG: universal stress protein [Flavipsychrobacter sp.]|nr:universal stress protein [Flavipsychrobacter sp.]
MKTILVPTDFSKSAKNALNYAIGIAQKTNAEILLVHAFQIHYAYNIGPYPTQFIENEIRHVEGLANAHLRSIAKEIYELQSVKCEYVSLFGEATDVILETIKQKKPYLVIMGTKGATGLKGFMIGSTAARIISGATQPVMAIPQVAKYHEIRKIVFATDYHKNDLACFKILLELAELYMAHIDVVHIYNGDNMETEKNDLLKFKEKIDKKYAYRDITYSLHLVMQTEDKLKDVASSKSNDLFVMSTHHRFFMESIWNRSITKTIANQIRIPLLALHTDN